LGRYGHLADQVIQDCAISALKPVSGGWSTLLWAGRLVDTMALSIKTFSPHSPRARRIGKPGRQRLGWHKRVTQRRSYASHESGEIWLKLTNVSLNVCDETRR
jgi:hypothetical protein